ncbi:MAG TPA: hypothetical protein VK638_59110 [Edaphobacter sp.]|nr:hypothetical protein [Edaphobacter sp.]
MRLSWLVMLSLPLLAGCPKTVTVTCTWSGSGNPTVPACGAPPCLLNYVLTNQNTGAVIAMIPITATSYSFSASTQGISGPVTLGLAVNERTLSGVVSSPKALSSVTVN